MVKGSLSRLKKFGGEARALWEERATEGEFQQSRFYKFLHFLVLVARSFVRNRCPLRASALAYTTLLALIPLLAVGLGVSTSLLKKDGVEGTEATKTMISKLVDEIAPQLGLIPQSATVEQAEESRQKVTNQINTFIQNTSSGTLNVTGAIGLILVAVGLLSTIEATFNDIWGVRRGRSWFTRLIYYWAAITFIPMLILLGMGLTISSNFQTAHNLISKWPVIGTLVFSITPYLTLLLVFMAIYAFMPNTCVRWKAAFIGAVIGTLLWKVNSHFNILFASRIVTSSKIYGSLSVLPVFLIGLYFSWLIVLFGAQIAYAVQNLDAYLQQRQTESVNQRGKEFVAFRLMTLVGSRFHNGEPPLSGQEMANELGVPVRLLHQLIQVFQSAGLIAETTGIETRCTLARPLEKITAHDILRALRTCNGQELPTRDEPTRKTVRSEFEKIQNAEKREASGLTLLAMVQEVQNPSQESKLE